MRRMDRFRAGGWGRECEKTSDREREGGREGVKGMRVRGRDGMGFYSQQRLCV